MYLAGDSGDFYGLTIAFPIQTLEKSIPETKDVPLIADTLNFDGVVITLFDKNGEILSVIRKTYFLVQFW